MSGPDLHSNYDFNSETFQNDIDTDALVANKSCELSVSEGNLIVTSLQNGSTPGVMLGGTFTLKMGVRYVLRVTGRNISSLGSPFLWMGRPPTNNISVRHHVLSSSSSTVTASIVPTEEMTNMKIGVLLSEATIDAQMELSRILFFSELIENPYELTTNLIKSVDRCFVCYCQ